MIATYDLHLVVLSVVIAVTLEPSSPFVSIPWLGLAIGITTLILLSLTLLTASLNRQLLEEHLRMAAIVESSYDAIISTSVDGIIQTWNSGALKLLGYSASEVKGQSLIYVMPSECVAVFPKMLEKLQQGEDIETFETVWQRKDGQPIHLSLRISPLQNTMGQMTGFSAIARDISEDKRIKKALEQQASELQAQAELLNLAHDTITVRHLDNTFTYWNRGAEEMYGWTPAEVLGQKAYLLWQTEFSQPLADIENQLLTTGRWEGELTHRKKDGTPIIVSSRWVMRYDQDGNPSGILEINNDISDRKRIEKELQTEREFLKAILENVSDGIVACDAEGLLTFFNRATTEFHGLSSQPLPPSQWAEAYNLYLADGKTPMKLEEIPLFKAWTGESIRNQEMTVTSQSGLLRTLLASGQPIFDRDGNKLGAVVSMRDITERKQVEEAQREKEALLNMVVKNSPIILYALDNRGVVTFSEGKGLEALGFQPSELVGMSLLEMYSDRPDIINNLHQVLAGQEKSWRAEVNHYVFDTRATPVFDESGQVIGLIAISLDVTLTNQAENALKRLNEELEIRVAERTAELIKINQELQAQINKRIRTEANLATVNKFLRQSEERFRLLVEGVKDYAIYILNPKGFIISWNPGAERITGYQSQEIIGKHFSCFYFDEDIQKRHHEYELMIAEAQGRYEEEGWRVRKDGSIFCAHVIITALRDEAGNLRGFSKITRDITDRKQDEQRFRKWADIFQHTGQGLLIASAGSRMLEMMNPAFAKMHGYTVEELTGKAMATIVAPDCITQLLESINRSVSQESQIFETYHMRKDGSIFPVAVDITTVKDKTNKILYSIVNVQDITQRKQAEAEVLNALAKERELSELKSRFISMTSHEFRTPLATILSSTELLEYYDHQLPEYEKRELFQQIETATQRMTQLLEDVLAINKAEAGKLEFRPSLINLESFCQSLLAEMQLMASNKHELIFTKSGSCSQALMDERLLHHIFSNLLFNAIKYSPQGGRIEFNLICDHQVAVFQVKDFGIGIPLEEQQKLFEPFHRFQNVGNIPGTGLGLSIVKKMVDIHQATIEFESEVGLGTNFTVTFPLQQGAIKND